MKIFILISFLALAACSTSSETRHAKQTADNIMDIASGNFVRPVVVDSESQFTIRGHIERNTNCMVLMNNLNIQVVGPLPATSLKIVRTPEADGTFEIISVAKLGKYKVSVVNSLNSNSVFASQELAMTESQDRFNLSFDVCKSK